VSRADASLELAACGSVASMPSLEVHGLGIRYHDFDPGLPGGTHPGSERAPVLCLPSTGLSGLQWRRLAKLLSGRGHRVLAVDLIGYGESEDWPRARAPFRTEFDVDVAAALRDRCAGPVHLVGHSYGGRVGLALALREPSRIRSLALFEPTCFGVLRSSGDPRAAQALAELDDFDRDGQFLADEFGGSPAWVERFVDYWSGSGSFAQFDPAEREAWLRSSRKMFEEVRETALDEVPHTAYATALAEHPALLLSGASSTLAGRRCAEILAASLARGRHVELPEVGHMGPILAAREVASLISEHIAEVDGN
jgi:pimeloyl-ACP methyl ester carboxylesterase